MPSSSHCQFFVSMGLLSELLIHLYTLVEGPHAPGCSHSTTRCCNVQLSLIGQV